ncbi:MAG TPA: response regulator [Chthoniobacterales bacterium]|nr:response regulator [Chthoniobacterales bacterium]
MPLIQLSEIPEPFIKRASVKGTNAEGLVFVIDDDDLFRKSIERLIRSVRLKVKAFASAEEFLRSNCPDKPACVVLDVRLGGMSGLDLQQRMTESGIDIPIIFMTGNADIRMGVYAMKAGAVEFLIKPFSDQDLIEAVQNGIERNRAARQLPTSMKLEMPGPSKAQDELNRLAGEIHDGVAQHLTAIYMQLVAAKDVSSSADRAWPINLDRAIDMAKRGLLEVRRCAHSLGTTAVCESSLGLELPRLAERWQVAGKWHCQFHCDTIPEKKVSSRAKHELLRIAQEAMHNAARHAKPTLIRLTLRWRSPNLILRVTDNGKGFSTERSQKCEGFGLRNMRKRAEGIDARFEVRTALDRGTSITITVPIS